MGVSNTSKHVKVNVMIQNSSQEPSASSKAPNDDLKDMDILCTFKIKRQRAKNRIKGISETSDNIQIKIKMPNSSQEPPAFSKSPKKDLKDMDVLCTFKIKIESQNSHHGCIKDQ